MQKTAKMVVFSCLFMLSIGVGNAYASCEVSANTLYPLPYSNNSITLSVRNTGGTDISWIKIPTNFTSSWMNITSEIQGSGWAQEELSDRIVYSGGSLAPGDSISINTTGNTGAQGESIYWGLSTSLNSDGSDIEACNTLEFSITNTPPGPTPTPTPTPIPTPPVLSALAVTAGATTATISWRSDPSASGVVNYGIGSEYGSTATGENDVYDHIVMLTGLVASTLYHYSVSSTNSNGTTTSTDNTFTTGIEGTSTTVTTTVTNTVTVTSTQTVSHTLILADTTKPTVSVTTKLAKAYTEPPIIEGKVVDTGAVNVGVVKIQYSTDNGVSWLLVDEPSGASKVDFSFVPEVYEDGNYQIIVRATDKSGNTGVSSAQTLVIDRLSPRIIHSLWRMGPIILTAPYQLIMGIPVQVTVQAVGGVTEMELRIGQDKYLMIKNFETGLWEGEIRAKVIGNNPVLVRAIDGGGNEIIQEIGQIMVGENADSLTQDGVVTTVYRLDELAKRYKPWNGEVYGQANPSTNKSSWYLPPGKYYIEAQGRGYKTAQSSIFNLDNSGVVGVSGKLLKWSFWGFWQPSNLSYTLPTVTKDQVKIVGNQILWLDKTIYRGKEIRLVVLPIWEPRLAGILANLKEGDVVVLPGANKSSVDLLKMRGAYVMDFVADPDGEILSDLRGVRLPINLMINRRGQVGE